MRRKFCQLMIAVLAYSMCVGLFVLSFVAIMHVDAAAWHAADYWFLWFSVFSFGGGLVAALTGTMATFAFFEGLCDSRSS